MEVIGKKEKHDFENMYITSYSFNMCNNSEPEHQLFIYLLVLYSFDSPIRKWNVLSIMMVSA
jgi:hypothetical protein